MIKKEFLPSIFWAVFIYILCALPGKSLPSWEWADLLSLDKLVHAFIFFTLCIFIRKGWSINYGGNKKILIILILLCIAYGGFLELLQEYVFNDRTGSVPDFIANTFGCFLSTIFYEKAENSKWVRWVFNFFKS